MTALGTTTVPISASMVLIWEHDPVGFVLAAHRRAAADRAIMSGMEPGAPGEIDYRFTLANERTFLAWIRTALALVAGGVAAAKALDFDHEVWRWVIAAPPIVAGAVLAIDARARWRRYEDAMRAQRPLPAGRGIQLIGGALAVYAVVALVVSALEG